MYFKDLPCTLTIKIGISLCTRVGRSRQQMCLRSGSISPICIPSFKGIFVFLLHRRMKGWSLEIQQDTSQSTFPSVQWINWRLYLSTGQTVEYLRYARVKSKKAPEKSTPSVLSPSSMQGTKYKHYKIHPKIQCAWNFSTHRPGFPSALVSGTCLLSSSSFVFSKYLFGGTKSMWGLSLLTRDWTVPHALEAQRPDHGPPGKSLLSSSKWKLPWSNTAS